ncbi:carboxypeptidase regulatory-like domain-containing protein, partial [bacterium]|nr:carboxypeptidase regulatory-like domain-containing protein [bacterium]
MLSRAAVLLFLFFTIAFNLPAWSQIITGSIRGVVKDSNGRPLAGATVIISKTHTGQTRSLTTNDLGVFHFPALPVGVYSVEARLDGFQPVRANRVEVDLSRTSNVPFTLNLAKTETIHVIGDSPMIDLQNAGVPTIFRQEMVENLPTRRHMWTLMQVAPGVTTDRGDDLDSGIIAFGSNRQSNNWIIDGLDITGPQTGDPGFEPNPDIIEQMQVYGVGSPAEYGNHTGAVLNVITKKGGNDLHGGVNSFFQSQAFTGMNVRVPDSDFVFHRDTYYEVTGQIGGPILRDKIWFFGAVQSNRDSYSGPGSNPDYAPLTKLDRYNLKITARLGKRYDLNGFFHDEQFDLPDPVQPHYAKSALPHQFGSTLSWGASLTSAFDEKILLETGYAGWSGQSLRGSQTDSLENPFFFFDRELSNFTWSGGIQRPNDNTTYRHQVRGKATYYADRFLKSQHEFKFGVQYFYGSAILLSGYGPNGSVYLDGYDYDVGFFKNYRTPFLSGSVSDGLGFFVDDTVTLNQRVTLNLGFRFDHNTGSIPDFDRLEVGTPSITEIGNFKRTGEMIPGVNNLVQWNLVSPRLGFVWRTREDGRAALRGS